MEEEKDDGKERVSMVFSSAKDKTESFLIYYYIQTPKGF